MSKFDVAELKRLQEFYRTELVDNCALLWEKHMVDPVHGGYYTCLDKDWKLYNPDKSVWFQGRGAWMFARLFNHFEQRPSWLETAASGIRFLDRHGFDQDGRMFFQLTADGQPLRKRRYAYSEIFAAMAYTEYYLATGGAAYLEKARQVYARLLDYYNSPGKLEPKVNPAVRQAKSLAMPMVLIGTSQGLREADPGNPEYDRVIDGLVAEVLADFYKPEICALLENVGIHGERLDLPMGRLVNPGHAIELVWFLLHEGIYRQSSDLIEKALNILDWSIELGWDPQYGGLLYFVDIEGRPLEQLEWDMKLWWPHTEMLYATLLAYAITGNSEYKDWFDTVHDYAFGHFADRESGEWYGYLHRDGTVANTLKGSLWKGPFHLPRALLLIYELLGKMQEQDAPSR